MSISFGICYISRFPHLSFPQRALYFSIVQEWSCEINVDSAWPRLSSPLPSSLLRQQILLILPQNRSRIWLLLFPFIPSTVVQVLLSLSRMMEINSKEVYLAASLIFPLPYLWSVLLAATGGYLWTPKSDIFPSLPTTAPHSSTLAWKIPWTEEPGRLQSMGLLRVGNDWATSLSLFAFMHWRRKWQPTPVFLPGESQGQESLVGWRLWGHTESDTTEVT